MPEDAYAGGVAELVERLAAGGMPRLVATTREIPDPGELLRYADRFHPLVFLRRGDGLVGLGQVFSYVGGLEHASATWRDLVASATVDDPVQLPGSGLIALGSFPFAHAASAISSAAETANGRFGFTR